MNPEIWRYIFDTSTNLVFLHDAQFRVLLANRAYCRAASMSEAEAQGKPYWEVFPPGDGPLPGCRDTVDHKGHDNSREEVRVGAKLFLSSGNTVRDDQGKILFALHILSDITALRQSEAALAESEQRIRHIIENARDAIIILAGESRTITAWNPAAEAMFGYSQEEMIGRLLHEIIAPPRFRQAARAGMEHFATTGEGVAIGKTLEWVALRKNGTEFPIELSLSALRISGHWHAIGIVRDITLRKTAEDKLRESEARYRFLFGNMLEGYAHCEMLFEQDTPIDLIYLSVNPAFEKITGLKHVIGKKITELIPGIRETNPELFEIYGRVSLTGQPERFETFVAVWDMWLSITVYGSSQGHFIAIFDDITTRKRAEVTLQNMAAQYHAVFESTSDAITLLDENGFFDCNGSGLRMFGYPTREEFMGKQPIHLSAPTQPDGEDSMSLVNERTAMALKGGSHRFEWLFRRPDGVEFFGEVLLTAMDLYGKRVLQGTVRDITARKQAEANLAEQMEELRRWHDTTLGREMRILELKHEVNELLAQAGQPPRYPSAEE
ncbi:MAG: PAS domain S-box protein [Methylococcaceae bacterium]|nr:PAS domain S-box protein [Methylococcaceae bacterium]